MSNMSLLQLYCCQIGYLFCRTKT